MIKENIYVAINRNDEIQWVQGSSKKTRYFKTDIYLKRAVEYHNKYHPDDIWKVRKCVILEDEPNCSEKPNNCEHITEDGVTCAKYPACDDCFDNPLNKVKGSERLVKGSEQTDCQTCKWWSSYGYCVHRECKGYEPQTESQRNSEKVKGTPQTDCPWK